MSPATMTIAMVPSRSPEQSMQLSLTSPSPSPSTTAAVIHNSPSISPVYFSPPLIAMVVVVATAFLIVTYSRLISRHVVNPSLRLFRQWRRRRRRSYLASSLGDIESPPYNSSGFDPSDGYEFHVFSPYGLDESVIKTIPLSVYTTTTTTKATVVNKKSATIHQEMIRDCAVCLLDFEENDYVRTLPVCSHAFHVDCIDIWLRSHANCPLCRAGIFRPESPFIPLMAARIRPSLDDGILESIFLEPLNEAEAESESDTTEIVPAEPSPTRRSNQSEDRFIGRDFLLKRSYSFGFERNFPSERIFTEPATVSPWRYRRGGSFWNKRPSPFCSLTKHRVFSFRHYRGGMKSPFFRRRGFFPLSENNVRYAGAGGGSSTRRSKSMTSPMFSRSSTSAIANTAAFSMSSRLRCGDPEALLSPERFSRR